MTKETSTLSTDLHVLYVQDLGNTHTDDVKCEVISIHKRAYEEIYQEIYQEIYPGTS